MEGIFSKENYTLRDNFPNINKRYTELTATRIYTILDNTERLPNIAATKSKLKIPTNPQFKPPTITRTSAI